MRLLLVCADQPLCDSLDLSLTAAGFNVLVAVAGEEALDLAKHYEADAIVIDEALPDMAGLDLVRSVRAAGLTTPALCLAGDLNNHDREVRCFGAGGDDYLRKPFHKDVLISRLRAIIRRANGHAVSQITVGTISVDLDGKRACVLGQRVHLTGKEFQVLELLALRRGVTMTKEVIMAHLYGGRDEPEIKIIDIFVCKVRRKLRAAGAGDELETVWGRGYRLTAEHEPAIGEPPQRSGRAAA